MHAATVGIDVDGLTRLEIKKVEWSKLKALSFTGVFGWGLRATHSYGRKIADHTGTLVGERIARAISRETGRVRQFAADFEKLKIDLRHVVKSHALPGADIVQKTDDLQHALEKLKSQTYSARTLLTARRPDSRVASAFEDFESAVSQLQGAIYRFRLVAIGADGVAERTWEESVEAGFQAMREASAHLADTSVEDVDPELLALAMKAVQQQASTATH